MESFTYFRLSRLFSCIFFSLLLFSMFGVAKVAWANPTFSAAFSPSTMGPGGTSTITFTIDNSANGSGVGSVAFSATLPTGMTITTDSDTQTTCNSAILSAAGGGNSISFSDGRLGSNQSCTVSMDVTSATPGTNALTTGTLTHSGGSTTAASANLTVDSSRPGFSMAFSPSTVAPNQISTLTYTIDNSLNGSNTDLLTFTHTLPTGLLLATNPNSSTTCTGGALTPIITATPGTDSISVQRGFVASGGNCTFQVDVISASGGVYVTTTGNLSKNNSSPSGTATARLTVQQPFMNVYFASDASPGQSMALTFEITNTDRSNDITGLSFTDDLNAALSGLTATALPANGFCGSGSSMSGTSNLTVSGVSLASGASCSFAVTVLVPSGAAAGSYTNTTSTINLTLGSATTKPAVSNTLVVKKAPTLTVSFIDGPALAGADVTGRFVITNTDTANTASAIAFEMLTDPVLTGVVIKTLPAANTCGNGSTFVSATNNRQQKLLRVKNGELAAGGSCTFDVVFTAPLDSAPGTYTFTTDFGSATISGSSLTIQKATASLQVSAAPTLTWGMTDSIEAGGSITIDFSLNHSVNSLGEATAIGFTIDLGSALTGLASTSGTQNDICGSGSSLSGTSTLTFSGGTLTAGTSCDFSITAAVPAGAAPATINITSSNVSATVSSTSVSSSAITDSFLVTGLTLAHSFVTNPALPGGTTIMRYVIANSAAAPVATAMQFTHYLSRALSSLAATSLPNTPCGASSTMTGSNILSFSNGELQPGTSCTFDVTVTIPVATSEGFYNIPTEAMSATVDGNNTETSASSATLTVETLSATLSSTAGTSTSVSPIPVTINFNRAVSGLVDADFTVTNGTASGLSGSGLEYTVNITPTANGAVTVQLPANAVDDAVDANHKNPASNQLSIAYSATSSVVTPTLVISSPSGASTNSGPITYGVTYTNADQISLSTSSISLNKTSTANATVTSGSTSTPTVTLSGITGDGTLGISIVAATARSNSGGTSAAAGPSTTFTVDNTKPTVTISDSVATSVNSAFTATFTISEAVADFAATDITVNNATLSAFNSTSGTVYTALITPTAEGAVTIDVAAGVTTDSVGNTNLAATQHSVTYDTTSPTVAISGATSPTNTAFTATITFNEDVTGFAQSDISVTNANLSGFTPTSASVYTVQVTPTNEGSVTLNVAASTAVDAAQNNNTSATQYSVVYDSVSPTVTITGATAPVNAAFMATVTFSEDVTGFEVADITAVNASLSNFSATSSSVYTVLITPTGQGNVTLDVAASVAADTATNNNTVATQYSILHDSVQPSVTISGPTTTTNSTTFTATITFNEDVTGFTSSDIVATNSTLTNFSATSTSVYTVDVTPTNQGNVSLDIAASAAVDSATNGNTAATQYSVLFDTVQPTVSISGATTATNAAFTATFTFSEDVIGFAVGDIVATNASLTSFASTDAKTYTVQVTPTAEGNVTLNVAASVAADAASNNNTAATEYSVLYDITSPTVTISGSSAPVNASFAATITFSEDVTGFAVGDIVANNASLTSFASIDAKTYTVQVTPTAEGNVTLNAAASVATDTAGNNNIAATQYSVLHDSVAPTVSITGPTTPTNSAFTATITFNEDVTGFDSSDISVNNATLSSFSATSAAVYTVQVTPTTQGNVTLDIAASAALDSASNGNIAATQYSVLNDSVQPTLTISGQTTPVNAAFIATFTFNEDVTGFAMSDISATNSVLSSFNSTSPSVYTVVVTPASEGSVTLDVATSVAVDSANNGNVAANQFTVNYDPTAPGVVISGPTTPVNAQFTATFTFSEGVTGFDISDVSATNANLSNFGSTSSSIYTATVTPIADGNVALDVANNVAVDSASNSNSAAAQYSISYDASQPTLNVVASANLINAAYTATFTFSETVTGFEIGDIIVTNGNASNFNATSGAVYSATITPASEGSVAVDVAAGVAADVAGNLNTAAIQSTTTYDITSPTVTLSADSAFMQTTKTVTFTFSEDVTGFALTDIGVTNGTAGSFTSVSSQVYTAVITASSEGLVSINVPASVALDSAGNANLSSNVLNLTSDTTAPTLSVSTPTDNSNSFGVSSNVVLQFSESVSFNTTSTGTLKVIRLSDSNTIAESTDLTLSSGTVTGQGTGTISTTTLTIDLTQNLAAGANYAVQISADFLLDSAGNAYAGISNFTDLNFVTMPSVILTVDRTQLIEEQLQTATATVSLQGPSSQAFSALSDVVVSLSFNGSTATNNTDYTVAGLNSNSITVSAGTSQSSFTMTTINDSPLADEPEQIVVSVDSVTTNNAVEVLEQQVTVSIVENAAPEATNVPTSITLVEDVKSNIDLSSVTVVDSEGDNLVLTLTLTNGTLNTITGTSNGATVTRLSDLSASVSGTISAINTLLDDQTAFAIIPPLNSTDSFTLSLSVSDGTETGPVQSIPVTITPVNDTPSLVSGSEDTFDVSGGTISSATSYTETQGSITMTVNIDSGNLVSSDLDTLGGTSGTALYTDTATTNQVTVAFSQKVNLESAIYFFNSGTVPSNITFTPTGSTGTVVTLAASDFTVDNVGTKIAFSGWTGVTGFTISSTGGSFAPGLDTLVFSPTPSNLSFQEDVQTSLDLSSLSLTDGDSTSLSLIISTNQGTLALPTNNRPAKSGVSSFVAAIATLSNNVITVTGTAAEINSFLSVIGNVLYTPAANSNGNESAMITVSVDDNDGSGAVVLQTILLDVTAINDAPEIANLNSDVVTYTQAGSAVNIDSQSNAVVTDVDDTSLDGGSLTVSISSGGDSAEDVLSFTGTGVSLSGTTLGSNVLVNSQVVGTLGNAIAEGNNLVVNFSSNATFANVGSLLNSISYFNSDITSPTTSNRVISIQVSDGETQSDTAFTTISFVPLDNSSNVIASRSFTSISSLADSQSPQTALILQVTDEGTDGVSTTITGIKFGVSGVLNADNMSFNLQQVQISNGSVLGTFQGQYSNGVLSFSDTITIPNGSSDINLQLNAWFNNNSNLSENDTITFAINPNSDVTVSDTGSQLGTITAHSDTSLILNVDATILSYSVEPAGSISGLPLNIQPVVHAVDSFGNLDLDFNGVVALTEFSAGSLSNNTVQASAGVATFSGLTYFAGSDGESFVLSANVVAGSGTGLNSASSDFLNSDVVATSVSFIAEISPNSINSDTLTQFSAVPVVGAVNAEGLVDQDNDESVVISEINGPGVANINVNGDIDFSSNTATLAFSSGIATFTGFEISYTVGGSGNESFNLSATSGTLSSGTSQIISVNDLPVLEGAPSEVSVLEDVSGTIDLSSLVLIDSDENDQTLSFNVSSGTLTIDDVAAQDNSILLSGSGTDSVSIAGSVTGIQTLLNVPDALTYLTALNDDTNATLTILANDGQVDSALTSISIAITAVNDAPVINGDGTASLALGDTYDFTPVASDVDNTTLVFSVENLPVWLSFDDETGRLFGVADRSATGISENIIISVSDAESTSSLAPFNIAVITDNEAPVISGQPSPTIMQDQFYSFKPEISDVDNDNLTITIENRPDWLTFNNQDGSLSGTPGNENVGTYNNILISVSDGQFGVNLGPFSIEVLNVNDAPEITGVPNSSILQDQEYSFSPEVRDIDGDSVTITIENRPDWLTFNNQDGSLSGTPGNENVGTYTNILISVSDGQSIANLGPFSIEVLNVNDAPEITGVPASSIMQDQEYSFSPEIRDIDGDSLTISIENQPEWLTFNNQDGSLNGAPGNENVGVYTDILITVFDGQATSNLGPFSIEVINVNDAPTISGLPATQVEVGVQYSFVPDVNDIDGDDLTFQETGAPDWLVLNPDTGELVGTPQSDQSGLYENIVLTVMDQELSASLPAFSINVIESSSAPTAESQTVTVNEDSTIDITLIGNDVNGDTLTYQIVESVAAGTLQLTNNIATYTPPENVSGITEQFSFVANDGQFDSNIGLVTISIIPVNDAPIISGNPVTSVKVLSDYNFTPQASDVEEDTLTFSIVNAPGWTQFDAQTGILSGQPAATDVGVYGNIVISVADQEISVSLPAFSIEVLVNTPPDINGSPAAVAPVSELYSFTPDVTDVDEDTLIFTVNNLPSWLSLNAGTGGISGTPAASDVGVYNAIQITVDDGINTVSLPSFNIRVCEVCDNQAPTIQGSPVLSIASGSSYIFEPQAVDPNGDTLVFSIENQPSWAVFDNTSGRLTGIPLESDVGVFTNIVIRVSDNQDTVALPSFDIEVTSSNSAPVIAGNPETSTFQGEFYEFTPTTSDSDGDNLIFSIDNRPQWAAFNPQTGRLSGTPVAKDVGTSPNIMISVTDNVNASVSLSPFNLEVIAKNSAPEISGDPRTSIRTGVEYQFEPVATDFDGDELTFSVANLPDWLVFDVQSGRLIGTPAESNIGEFTGIVISVTDNTDIVSLPAFSITVENDNSVPLVQNLNITVDEDKDVNINAGATDDNQDELILTVLTPPDNGSLTDTSNGWRYTPNENFNGSDSFIYEASDGQLQSEPATVSILVGAVNDKPIAEDDAIALEQVDSGIYLLDVLANDIDVDVETNQDVITLQRVSTNLGTATVVDNQVQLEVNQSFLGSVDLTYSIRDEDSKNDTARVTLTINGVDNVNAPVITLASEVIVDATGLSTKVDFGDVSAVDADGNSIPVGLVDEQVNFAPGAHTVYWQAEDSFGTTTIEAQSIVVNPIISLDTSEFVVEGGSTIVRVLLNGDAPSYPYSVSYELSGNAQNGGVDYSVTGGTLGSVTFNDGTEQNFVIEAFNDDEIEGDENITLTLTSGQNIGGNGTSTIIISENNVAPTVALEMFQNGELRTTVAQDQGIVSIVATVTDQNIQDTVAIEWTSNNIVNQSTSDEMFEFDPNEFTVGFDTISVYVNDDGEPILDSTNSIDFEIVSSFIVLSETEDTDGDLIPDAQDGFGDDDGDGIVNYLDAINDCNVIAANAENQSEFLIESDPSACMRQGETSGQNESNGLQVVTTNVAERKSMINKSGKQVTLIANNLPEDSEFENIGGIYDFIIYDLPQLGQSARVVIPQTVPVSEGAIIRKYNTSSEQWDSFVRDDKNLVSSFSGERGICPAPGSDSWQLGLISGAWCVQLTIEDGGQNDDDGITDGVTKYLGGVAVFAVDNASPIAQDDQLAIKWNSEVEINVLDNDSDPDNDVLTLLRASANIGTVSVFEETRILYVANPGYSGADLIEYIVSDGNGGSASASVTLTIVGNRAPGAVDDFAETDHRTVIEINVLENDIDVDNDELSIINAMAEVGDVAITAQNTLMYTPKLSFSGLDSVNYVVEDEAGATDSATVSVFVNGNEAPTANNDSGSTLFQTPITINVIANDSDPDGDELMVIDASVSSGTVLVGDDNRLTFTPAANFSGSVTITYTVSDGILTATATVTIEVAKNIVETNISNKSGGAMSLMLIFGLLLLTMSKRRFFKRD